jgi:DNA-binding HxlR family transcriptional regulator
MGRTRFKHFLDSSPGLPSKVLSDRLKKLEDSGLVRRVVYSQHPLRAEYRLTEKGRSLAPVLEAIVQWGIEHCFEGEPEVRAAVAEKLTAGVLDAAV